MGRVFRNPCLTGTAKWRHKMRWVVTILLEYEWRNQTPQSETEREIMQINTQGNIDSSLKSEALKDNQFLVAAVPPGSAVLVGDAAVFSVLVVSVRRRLNVRIGEAH